ncbi:MFS transporter [Corynebacterium otitidis]|uniref:Major facilitator superfamily (MFS) profile domain-containing protein n=1 Tax=Corynebacterium otitidis ATCC 51513 TaxID=883169 RepID=K0YQS0_9CORY|nr:MFS transporter [Corynebacterium otitidis]EJZ81889.1 hypothetical protein HMPREF9719_01185 [Corynebacterium otitidis ATCC 51513]
MSRSVSFATRRRRILFQAIPIGLFLALLSVGLPSGLFDLYRERYGFDTSVQTLLFALYAFTLVPSLLITPFILRYIRPVTLYAIGIVALIVADVVFLTSGNTALLFVGRGFQGVTVAFLNAAAPQLLLELQRRGWGKFDSMILSMMTSAGLGLGLFGAKLVSGTVESADRWLFVVHLAVTAVFVVSAALLKPRDTAGEGDNGDSETGSTKLKLRARPEDHDAWNSIAGVAAGTAWAMGGLYLGLGTMIGDATAPRIGAFVPFIFFMAMLVGQAASRALHDVTAAIRAWLPVNAAGAILTALGVVLAGGVSGENAGPLTALVALTGSALGGVSLGLVFVVATDVFPRTIDLNRAGTQTAFFFSKVFGGNSLPTLGVGILTPMLGLGGALGVLAAGVTAMTCYVLIRFSVLDRRARRAEADDAPQGERANAAAHPAQQG